MIAGLVGSSTVYLVAGATGVPTTNPLTYRGVLEEGGAPVTGSRDIQLRMWNHATATAASNLECTLIPAGPTTVDAGRFELVLGPECVSAVGANPDLWIEVLVGGVSLGRSSVGAVPYALETPRRTYVNPTTGRASSNGGYCGASVASTGLAGGYVGAKALCETACQSATAHVCSPHEVIQYAATGGTMAAGRIQTGAIAVVDVFNGVDQTAFDCGGWSTGDMNSYSILWSTTGPGGSARCNVSMPFACCD